jgi:hypothetical protein
VAGRYSSVVAGPVATDTGDFTGTSTVIAADGNCVTTPITSVTSVLTGHIV